MSNNYFRQSQQQQQQPQQPQQTHPQQQPYKQKSKVAAIYVQKDSDFPDLIPVKKETTTLPVIAPNNYAKVVAISNDKKERDDEHTIPDGWTQITINKKTGKKEIKVNPVSSVKEETVGELIVKELQQKWDKYKLEYDSIHGEGAFKEAHYSEPVYPFLDEEYDSESDHSDYSAETEGDLVDKKL